ncbi:hypothetical protein GPECTOR_31g304 [Gonium pectorale]|uniref:Uncharacterized protein n=1 Tax=Gonium pectorale TaxID=33097 RepID=A0A150GDM5_GONPE|nr:hypothetical protein GPECTOR_31g304 [Gonium pectorale]|eukprot:KXZ47942.1 hypothetical protein GPECTOR_31g304 [Gonium pectorale]
MLFVGRFGRWSITPEDRLEVVGYRLGISATALAFLFEGLFALLPPEQEATRSAMRGLLDPVALLGAGGLGVSLQLIHIYLAPLKRALQVLWLLGTAGALFVMATQDDPAAVFVYDHALWVWAVGPLFAALTGVAFKEGLCYNKWEAAGLFGAVPLTVGGHLLHLFPTDVERGLLASCCVLLAVFAGRKYTQAYKDDIGDKSIFEFQKLSHEEQMALLKRLGQD